MFLYKLHFYRTTFSGSVKSNLCICVNFYKYFKTDIPLSSSIHTLFFFYYSVRQSYIEHKFLHRGTYISS
jgi:hypothetical protein